MLLEQQRRQLETFFQGHPVLDAARVDQVFRLRADGGRITWEAPLIDRAAGAGGRQYRAELQGLTDGLTTVYLGRSRTFDGPGNSPAEFRTFSLTHYDFSRPGVLETLSVQAQQDYFHVDCSAQLPEGYRSVRLTEQGPQLEATPAGSPRLPPAGAPEGTAQLTITRADANNRPQMVNLVEPDFQSLVRRHPREVEEYVRPMLARLGQDAVFAPDPLVAWQVFSDRWVSDDAMRQQVAVMLPALDAPDFRARDEAVRRLLDLGRPGAAVLLRLDRSKLSAEQCLRIDRILRPYAQLPAPEAAKLRSDVGFLLDCLYVEDAHLRRVALDRLRDVTGQPLAFDLSAGSDRRAAAVNALRQKLQPARDTSR